MPKKKQKNQDAFEQDIARYVSENAVSVDAEAVIGTGSLLPKRAIEDFKKLFKKQYGKELDDVEAVRRANNLVRLYRTVYCPAPFGRIKHDDKSKNQKPQPDAMNKKDAP